MHRNSITKYQLLITLFFLSACSTLLPPKPAITWDTSSTALIVRASECCGLVPQTFVDNYIPEAQLWGDGRLVWVQNSSGGARRVFTAMLTPAEVEALLEEIVDAGFFGWQESYADHSVTDMPSTCLQVTLLSAAKTVCEYYQGAPKAFHRLLVDLSVGAGQTGTEFVPQRGYLTAYPLPTTQTAPTPNWQWPAASVGLSLADAQAGRWVEGPALELAWSIVGANHWNTLVQDGDNYYEVTLIVPEVSWVKPPAGP